MDLLVQEKVREKENLLKDEFNTKLKVYKERSAIIQQLLFSKAL